MTTLLITPTLNSTNQFATSFALHLLKSGRFTKRQLFALVSPKDGTKISKSLEPYFEGGQLNILFGSANSQKIVKRVVEVNEIPGTARLSSLDSLLVKIQDRVTLGSGDGPPCSSGPGTARLSSQKFDGKSVHTFLGVPYAKSPTGSGRFGLPEMIEPWEGEFRADKPARTCFFSRDTMFPDFPGAEMWNPPNDIDEDCLAMNIWVPEHHDGTVLVWIYGGGFYSGSPSLDLYDGRVLAVQERAVVININYRLGPFGFLYFGDDTSVPGNMGLQDQQMALKWIHEHIAHFGGDPRRVTLFGESAGSASAMAHMFADGSYSLFSRIIAQNEDTHFFRGNVFDKLRRKNFKRDVSILVGTVRDEGTYWLPYCLQKNGFGFNHTISPEDHINKALISETDYTKAFDAFLPYFGNSNLVRHALMHAYSHLPTEKQEQRWRDGVARFLGDYIEFADIVSDELYGSVYSFYFTRRSSANPWPQWMGAMHGYEIEYVFGLPLRSPHLYDPSELELEISFSTKIMEFWGHFARTGEPVEFWPKYNRITRKSLVLSEEIATGTSHRIYVDVHGKLCRLLEEAQAVAGITGEQRSRICPDGWATTVNYGQEISMEDVKEEMQLNRGISDFGTSTMEDVGNTSALFGSVMGGDPRLVSTDSLDIEMLRMRCENNKQNDYKLTFEDDSGQWTTSGIGASFMTNASASPTALQTRKALRCFRGKEGEQTTYNQHHPSLRLLERLNSVDDEDTAKINERRKIGSEKWRDKILDEIFNNNNGSTSFSQIYKNSSNRKPSAITWGRIGCNFEAAGSESNEQLSRPLAFDSDKVNSLPVLHTNTSGRNNGQSKNNAFIKGDSSPAVAPSQSSRRTQTKIDFNDDRNEDVNNEYSEFYLGDGRYIDMNHNEIGFTPNNTNQMKQHDIKQNLQAENKLQKCDDTKKHQLSNRQTTSLALTSSANNAKKEMPRTFADLSPSKTAPDLQFIALSYKVPSICTNSSTIAATTSFDDLLKQAKEGNLGAVLECYPSEKMLFEPGRDDICEDVAPDSGLGSSHSEGPSHIEDWHSLSVLLPRHVVDACSFFKTNSFLLGVNDNNIDKRRCYCCHASTMGSGRRFYENKWQKLLNQKQNKNGCCCCDNEACVKSSIATFNPQRHRLRSNTCLASTVTDDLFFSSYPIGSSSTSHENYTLKRLHQRELAIIGLPIYEQKRGIVERVVAGVGEQVRGAPTSVVLLAALEALFVDGLHSNIQPWDVIRQLTGKGPVTASIFQLCEELEVSEKPKNSLVSHFFQGLIALHSVDCWFSYIVLKEHQLRKFYVETSFLLGANTSYRCLFARFIDYLELLSVLNLCNRRGSLSSNKKFNKKRRPLVTTSSLGVCERNADVNSVASKLPSDSRVPKSSSLPSRITLNSNNVVAVKDENPPHNQINKAEGKTINASVPKKRRSMIPVLSSRSKSNATSYYLHVYHSRSSSRRSTPMHICNVKENVSEDEPKNITKKGTLLNAYKGEQIGVISVRGQYSRCVRLGSEDGKLVLRNGVIPTDKLEFLHTD
uniref:Acetylcholinesterase n=1 Tax=Meloidogyne javanica TaxID=6303 RepID=A0A915MGH7_MELJA